MDQPSIEYSVCTAGDTGEMTRLLAEVFSGGEPPAIAVGLTAAEFASFVQPLCPAVIAEGLTIVARRADTAEMVGALLTQDFASALPEGVANLSPKFDPIFDILGLWTTSIEADASFLVASRFICTCSASRPRPRGTAWAQLSCPRITLATAAIDFASACWPSRRERDALHVLRRVGHGCRDRDCCRVGLRARQQHERLRPHGGIGMTRQRDHARLEGERDLPRLRATPPRARARPRCRGTARMRLRERRARRARRGRARSRSPERSAQSA